MEHFGIAQGTVNVTTEKAVERIMDCFDQTIRSMCVFHCKLLSQQDKFMMAKMLFE
jgi:hypothetical protein